MISSNRVPIKNQMQVLGFKNGYGRQSELYGLLFKYILPRK